MSASEAVFLVNLLQDVNILRPLVLLARDCGLEPRLLVTRAFASRDRGQAWTREIDEVANACGARIELFGHASEAAALLKGGGIIFAGSESNLQAHGITHDVLRLAPASYVTVTLQHGFECVGFLQSKDHTRAHGAEVTFAADMICGWCAPDRLSSVAPSQRPKLLVTGPTALLQQPRRGPKAGRGIVCENLHSVRFSSAGDFKADFVTVFKAFCAHQASAEASVTLRPHPGGQYTLRNNVPLPPNVLLNNNPIYKVDLAQYSYGISAPSSILIDMVLAGIPTAVWSDKDGAMDAGHYTGLAHISTLKDWIAFAREAEDNPAPFLERQAEFLERWGFQRDPQVAYQAFVELMSGAARRARRAQPAAALRPARHVLFVANNNLPTLQICFQTPLSKDVEAGAIQTSLLTEEEMRKMFPKAVETDDAKAWILRRLSEISPDIIVFCRYSGPHADVVVEWARKARVPTVFHIDDDLLSLPREFGDAKYNYHNDPKRTGAVEYLVANVDLLYCVNPHLRDRLSPLRGSKPTYLGRIAGPGVIVKPATSGDSNRIGYMVVGRSHDLQPLVQVVSDLLDKRPGLEFHLFGNTTKPEAWERFGKRIVTLPFMADYAAFRTALAALDWAVGVVPVLKIPFNLSKTNLKWVEYTSVAIPVIASKVELYEDCCADGCGILADTPEEWSRAIEYLLDHPEERLAQVQRAQTRLTEEYSSEALRRQILAMFDQAMAVVGP